MSHNFATSEVPGEMPQALDYNLKTDSYHHPKSKFTPTTQSQLTI